MSKKETELSTEEQLEAARNAKREAAKTERALKKKLAAEKAETRRKAAEELGELLFVAVTENGLDGVMKLDTDLRRVIGSAAKSAGIPLKLEDTAKPELVVDNDASSDSVQHSENTHYHHG